MPRANRLSKIAVVLISTLVALVFAEFLVRAASKYSLHLFDVEMWRYASEVKRESGSHGLVEEHRANAEAMLMGVRIRTDPSGFRRTDPGSEILRQTSNRVIVALGDSLTLGWGVPEGETYSDVLERTLNRNGPCKVNVLNAGIGNSNTSMELARYEQGITPLHPDWLILGFFINDAEPDPKPAQSIWIRNSAVVNLISVRVASRFGPYSDYAAYYRDLYQSEKPGWVNFQSSLKKLGESLQRDNVRATILLLPEMHEPKNFGPFKDLYNQVAAIAQSAGFEVIDASSEFPAGSGRRFWVSGDDAHPNAEAHQIFTSALAKSTHFSVDDCNK